MEDYLITHKSIKISDEELKQEIELNKKWYDEFGKNIRNEFSIFLESIKASNKIIDLSKKVNWKNILVIVNKGISELWEKFTVPEHLEEANKQGGNFRSEMINHIKINLFFNVYLILISENKTLGNKNEINKELFDEMRFKVYSVLRIFDFQYSLTSLQFNDDPKIIPNKVKELYDKNEELKKYRGKKFRPEEIPTYEIILKEIKKITDKGYNVVEKSICDKWAKINHNYRSKRDLLIFSKRFYRYKKYKEKK